MSPKVIPLLLTLSFLITPLSQVLALDSFATGDGSIGFGTGGGISDSYDSSGGSGGSDDIGSGPGDWGGFDASASDFGGGGLGGSSGGSDDIGSGPGDWGGFDASASDFGGGGLGGDSNDGSGGYDDYGFGGFDAGNVWGNDDSYLYDADPVSGGSSYGYGNEDGFTGSSDNFGDYDVVDVNIDSNGYSVGDIMNSFSAGNFYDDDSNEYDAGFAVFDSFSIAGGDAYGYGNETGFTPYVSTVSNTLNMNTTEKVIGAVLGAVSNYVTTDGTQAQQELSAEATNAALVDAIAAAAKATVAARQSTDVMVETLADFALQNATFDSTGTTEAAVFAVGNQLLDNANTIATEAEINGLLAVEFARQGNTQAAEAYATLAEYQATVVEARTSEMEALNIAALTDTYEDLLDFAPVLTEDFELITPAASTLALVGLTEDNVTLAHATLLGLNTDILSNQNTARNVEAVGRMFAGELDPTTRANLINGRGSSADYARAAAILTTAINRAGSRGTSIADQVYRDQQYSFWNEDKRAQFADIYSKNKSALDAVAREFLSGDVAKAYTNIDELVAYPTANHYQNTDEADADWAYVIETLGTIKGYSSDDSHTFYDGYYPVSTPTVSGEVQSALAAIDEITTEESMLDNIQFAFNNGNVALQLENGKTISFSDNSTGVVNALTLETPIGNVTVEITSNAKYSDAEARDVLSTLGISVNKTQSQGTSLNGVNGRTLAEVALLSKECECSNLVVTGGTESGHASGKLSHSNGYKADIRAYEPTTGQESEFTEYAKDNFTLVGTRSGDPIYQNAERPDVVYVLESDHWDITVPPSDGESQTTSVAAIETTVNNNGSETSSELSFSTGTNGASVNISLGNNIGNALSSIISEPVANIIGSAVGNFFTGSQNNAAESVGNIFSSILSRVGTDSNGSLFNNSGNIDESDYEHPLANIDYSNDNSSNSSTNTGPIQSDITATALRADASADDEYRFRGSLTRTLINEDDNLSFDEISARFESSIENELFLDIHCDGVIDESTVFTTPYRSILPRSNGTEVFISEYLPVPQNGLHCFAFEVDINDDIDETNENNNMTQWKSFITNFNGAYDEESDTSLPDFMLEVSSYTAQGTVTHDWTTNDISIDANEELAFRWDAADYDSCIPFIYPVNYSFAEDVFTTVRDTDEEQIDVRELDKTYVVRCQLDGDSRSQSIVVDVQ